MGLQLITYDIEQLKKNYNPFKKLNSRFLIKTTTKTVYHFSIDFVYSVDKFCVFSSKSYAYSITFIIYDYLSSLFINIREEYFTVCSMP